MNYIISEYDNCLLLISQMESELRTLEYGSFRYNQCKMFLEGTKKYALNLLSNEVISDSYYLPAEFEEAMRNAERNSEINLLISK